VRTDVPPEHRVVARQPGADKAFDERLPLVVLAKPWGRAASRQLREDLGPIGGEPGLAADEVRRVRRDREQDREPGEDRLEAVHAGARARHADVHVQAVYATAAGRDARVITDRAVTLTIDAPLGLRHTTRVPDGRPPAPC